VRDELVDSIVRPVARKNAKSQFPDAFLAMLAERGFTPHSASVALGSPDLLRNFGRGKSRSLRGDSLLGLANLLGRSMDEVAGALGIPVPPGLRDSAGSPGFESGYAPEALRRAPVRSGPQLPVRYVVQAGHWIEHDELAQERIASPPVTADPNFPPGAQWLELVRGDSADLFYPEGVFVHVVDAIEIGYAPRHEDFVVVQRTRDEGAFIERSLKQVAKKGRKIELWPRSRNPKWKAPLDISDSRENDVVEIAALVLGGYLPARR
jgi:hypothetical protein